MTPGDSPDVLEGGHWETVCGVQRWVWDIAPSSGQPSSDACVDCGVEFDRPYAVGKCRRCYDRKYRKGTMERRPSTETAADWRELKARGFSIREAARVLGMTVAALNKAIVRANHADRECAA